MATKISRIDQQVTGDHYLEDAGYEQQHVDTRAEPVDQRPATAQYWRAGVPGWYKVAHDGEWWSWPTGATSWRRTVRPAEYVIRNLVPLPPEGAQFYCPESNRYLRMSGTEPPDQVWIEGLGWQFYGPLASREGLIELDHSGDTTEKADHIPGAGKKIRMAELYPDYYRDVRHLDEMDVYAVHDTFRVDDPSGCLQHASKKILLSGTRNGGKSLAQDIKEARDTLTRKLQLMGVE
jgi:hypothetical protein